MSSVSTLIKQINSLNHSEKEAILDYLEEVITIGSRVTQFTEEVKESRFSRGKVCPRCRHEEISRNGKFKGKQRYICKSCRKTFTDFTRSPRYNSKKDVSKWMLYAKCMVNGYSIRKCAEIIEISVPTSFYWRHKILDAIRTYMHVGSVGGVIEVDETFFRESFKGNHSRSSTFAMPRKSRKRGAKGSWSSKNNKEKRKRGISDEQVCVMCAVDRMGNIISEPICKGRMKHSDLERLFDGKIDDDSILCTDSHKSFISFAKNMGIELQQIPRGKHKEGIYHIQHINAFHNNLKRWMSKFNGVATKYLSNYLYWFRWLQMFNSEKDSAKSKHLIVQSHSVYSDTKIKSFKTRQAKFA